VSNNLITHNNFDLDIGVSSSITMKDGTNIDIVDNRLHGGTYNIYFEGNSTGCDVTNNVFAASLYGDVAGTSEGSQSYSGNVYSDTSVIIGTGSTTNTNTTSAPSVVPAASTTPTIETATTAADSGQVDSSSSYAGPMGWAGLMATGSHDTFAFAANFGRDVTTGFSASQGGPDIAVGQTVSQTAFNAFAADLAHAAPTPLGGQHLVDEDAFGLT
jgi:hypothetical protein